MAIVRCLELTGMRRSECAGLLVSDIDFDAERIAIRRAKNNEARYAPLHPLARRALRRWLADREGFSMAAVLDDLWLTRDGALTSDGIRQMLAVRARQTGTAPLTAHTFRRGFAHRWAEAGMPDDSLMHVAGWRNPTMPSRYRSELAKERAVVDFARAFPTAKIKIVPGPRKG